MRKIHGQNICLSHWKRKNKTGKSATKLAKDYGKGIQTKWLETNEISKELWQYCWTFQPQDNDFFGSKTTTKCKQHQSLVPCVPKHQVFSQSTRAEWQIQHLLWMLIILKQQYCIQEIAMQGHPLCQLCCSSDILHTISEIWRWKILGTRSNTQRQCLKRSTNITIYFTFFFLHNIFGNSNGHLRLCLFRLLRMTV